MQPSAPARVRRHIAKRLWPRVSQVVVTDGIEPRVAVRQQLHVLQCHELLCEAMMQAIGLDRRAAFTGPRQQIEPHSQLAMITLMLDMIGKDGQFVIATHSPILLAFPGATIYTFDRTPPERVAFEDLEHVNLTRAFLNDPGSYLRRLR